MKRLIISFGLLATFLMPVVSAHAFSHSAKAPLVAGPCTKANATSKAGTVSLICHKVGKKLIWQKTTVKVALPASSTLATLTPTPKPTATATPTQSPSATASASAGASSLPTQSSYEINVNAKAFSWSFTYAVSGEKSVRMGSEPTLYLPVGKPVQLTISSTDTSHGFWLPGLGIDKEAAADTKARITITAEKIGKFPGACNIQCGRGHSGMVFTAEVVSESDYLKIISALKAS